MTDHESTRMIAIIAVAAVGIFLVFALLVAVTLVLATGIGAFVLGVGEPADEGVVGIDVVEDGEQVTVTWTAEGAADWIVVDDGDADCSPDWNGERNGGTIEAVGGSVSEPCVGTGTITAVAVTDDGIEVVVRTHEFPSEG